MAYNYLIPVIGVLHKGYDITIDPSFERIGGLLADGFGQLVWRVRLYHDGEMREASETPLVFEGGRLASPRPNPFFRRAEATDWSAEPGFFEVDFVAADGSEIFIENHQSASYPVCSAPGRKSFFPITPHKFAVPPVIDMVAAFGRFVETYPVVWVDRERDFGETIVMINPYNRPLVAEVVAHDGRALPRLRVPALAARNVRLERLLEEGENVWRGRIQITANNRVVTLDVRHSLADPTLIWDEEHLDPFRADPTHLPGFQSFRQGVGRHLLERGLLKPQASFS